MTQERTRSRFSIPPGPAAIVTILIVASVFLVATLKQQNSTKTVENARASNGMPASIDTQLGNPEAPDSNTGTLPASWQTKAPEVETTHPAMGVDSSQDPDRPWIQPPQQWYDGHSRPVYPMPAEHPYNPRYPPRYPTKMNTRYNAGGMPQVSDIQRDEYWGRYVTSGTKPPLLPSTAAASEVPATTAPTPQATRMAQGGTTAPPGTPGTIPAEPYDAIIPTAPAPTETNIMDVSEMDNLCPIIPPKAKLELAIRAWTAGRRSGVQSFDVGSVDMGQGGGWYDNDNRRCCDHYCRRVGNKDGSEYWSCISPQAPASEYAAVEPKGLRCTAFAGNPPAPTGQTG